MECARGVGQGLWAAVHSVNASLAACSSAAAVAAKDAADPTARATTTSLACAQGVLLKKALATAVRLNLSEGAEPNMSKELRAGINSICAEFVNGSVGSEAKQDGLDKRMCGSAVGRAFAMLTAPNSDVVEGLCRSVENQVVASQCQSAATTALSQAEERIPEYCDSVEVGMGAAPTVSRAFQTAARSVVGVDFEGGTPADASLLNSSSSAYVTAANNDANADADDEHNEPVLWKQASAPTASPEQALEPKPPEIADAEPPAAPELSPTMSTSPSSSFPASSISTPSSASSSPGSPLSPPLQTLPNSPPATVSACLPSPSPPAADPRSFDFWGCSMAVNNPAHTVAVRRGGRPDSVPLSFCGSVVDYPIAKGHTAQQKREDANMKVLHAAVSRTLRASPGNGGTSTMQACVAAVKAGEHLGCGATLSFESVMNVLAIENAEM